MAKRPVTATQPEKASHGLLAPLLNDLNKQNPKNFSLPQDLRDHYEGVATGKRGEFMEVVGGNKSRYGLLIVLSPQAPLTFAVEEVKATKTSLTTTKSKTPKAGYSAITAGSPPWASAQLSLAIHRSVAPTGISTALTRH